jgi:N-acetylglucosamine-6-phosphate deacetylase
MKCSGIDVSTGEQIHLSFEKTILSAEPVLAPLDNPPYFAPGWIDMQVNGYSGVE